MAKPKAAAAAIGEDLVLEAGTELDATILERVFGFPKRKTFIPVYSVDRYYIPSGKPLRTHQIDAVPVPRFSRDLAAAWLIIVELRRRGAYLIYIGPSKTEAGFTARLEDGEGTVLMSVDDQAAPMAICRLVIEALRRGSVVLAPKEATAKPIRHP